MERYTFTRPKVGETLNGDAFLELSNDNMQLFSVVDGLGHGPKAHTASEKAIGIMKDNNNVDLIQLLELLHQGLHDTRGVVAAIIKFDILTETMEYAGLGNIEIHCTNPNIKPISMAGILGHNWRTPKAFKFKYQKNDLFAMFSDGISGRFDIKAYSDGNCEHAANRIFDDFGKDHDDATVMVIRT